MRVLTSEIHARLSAKTTDELLEIYQKRDLVEWTETALNVTKEILIERGALTPEKIDQVESNDLRCARCHALLDLGDGNTQLGAEEPVFCAPCRERRPVMSEETKQNGSSQAGRPAEENPAEQNATSLSLGGAACVGAIGGAVLGLVANYLAGGMRITMFIVAYVMILSGLKGWGKLVGIMVATAVAALVVVLF